MDNMKHRRLQELDRSDFGIVEGEPDIRGWDVKNTRGQKIGEVEELIVDARQKKVRYMVVDLDDNDLDIDDDHKVLIPIGLAELHRKDDDVIVPVEAEQLKALPDYDSDKLDAEVERRVCSTLGRKTDTMVATDNEITADFYKHDYYNDDNLYKNRLHEARPVQNRETEYDRGLRLWERRSEGGLLADDDTSRRNREERQRELREEERMEMVRNRRNNYEQRRNRNEDRNYQDNVREFRKDNSIERRTRDEGLQDA